MTLLIALLSVGIVFILLPFVFWFFRNVMLFIFHKNWSIFNYFKWFILIGCVVGVCFIIAGILAYVIR